jgi:F0F1-type ATP synthase gamma subunit
MEDAEENVQDIIKELQTIINIERKRKITQEMQELGSGLLEK